MFFKLSSKCFVRLSELSILMFFRTGATNSNHHIKCLFRLRVLTVKKKKESILFESLSDKCLGIITENCQEKSPGSGYPGGSTRVKTANQHGKTQQVKSKRLVLPHPLPKKFCLSTYQASPAGQSVEGPSTDGSFSSSNHHIKFSKI